jgi:hypothetical protein
MRLTKNEASDLFASIDLGWAKPVNSAYFRDDQCEHTFYRLDGKVYYINYVFANTVSECYEVEGEDLEIFNIYHKEGVEA